MGTLRIVAGRFRGRRLPVPDDPDLRPTADRVRESLFNILGRELAGRSVLDLYAGSGACGLEALSRGATRVIFVEAKPRLAQSIRRAAEHLGVERDARIVIGRVEDVLDRARLSGPFDVILADPPYAAAAGMELVALVEASGLLSPQGVLVIERDARRDAPSGTSALRLERSATYGGTALDFFKFS